MDIGCARPREGNVTYILYKMGWSGIVIDAREVLRDEWLKSRPRDVKVFCPLTASGGQFYIEQAGYRTRLLRENHKNLESIKSLSVIEFVALYKKYFSNNPRVIKIDVEGLEFEILKELLNQKIQCEIFIIEVVDQVGSNFQVREEASDIIGMLQKHRYKLTLNDGVNLWFISENFKIDEPNIWAPPYPGNQENYIPSHLTVLNQFKTNLIRKLPRKFLEFLQ
jgi:hypothetical protein